MLDQSIIDWLSHIPVNVSPNSSQPDSNRKRRHYHDLPSPAMSDHEMATSPSKRVCVDPDATPTRRSIRPTSELSSMIPSHRHNSASASSSPTRKTTSSRASSIRDIALLRQDRVVDSRTFNELQGQPPSLRAMKQSLKRDMRGDRIIPQDTLDSLRVFSRENPLFQDMLGDDDIVDTTGARAELGEPPRPEKVMDILMEAQECEKREHSEASWNCAVHYPLLKEAIRGAGVNTRHDSNVRVGCLNATTASLIPGYAPTSGSTMHSKRVDFCCYLELEENPDALESLRARVRTTTNRYINHTDYLPLLDRPLCLSLETKKTGEEWKSGLGKMTSWFAGQWKRIGELTDASPKDSSHIFLPGLVVQGHAWYFVAATQGQVQDHGAKEMILWHKVLIGSTDDVQGIYSIIAAIQRLVHWSAHTYWPWFREAAIDDQLVMRG